jgi:DNA-binding NarL/FixJ family response regulator
MNGFKKYYYYPVLFGTAVAIVICTKAKRIKKAITDFKRKLTMDNVLVTGIEKTKSDALRELPIRVIAQSSSKGALDCLRRLNIDSIISNWEMPDAPDGHFIKRIKDALPSMPVIAVVESGNAAQEIAARCTGVSAVITDDIEPDEFRELIAEMLGVGVEAVSDNYKLILGSAEPTS